MTESSTFTTLKEFNKQYDLLREDILIRHGYEKGARGVRLKNAIMLYQNFNGTWVKMTSIKTDMTDRIKMSNISGSKKEYMLKAMV